MRTFDDGWYVLDEQGEPVPASRESAAALYEQSKKRRVGEDYLWLNNVRVSTVFMPLDHNYDDDGPPLVFETMIFGGGLDQSQWRCSTRTQALAQHAHALRLARWLSLLPERWACWIAARLDP